LHGSELFVATRCVASLETPSHKIWNAITLVITFLQDTGCITSNSTTAGLCSRSTAKTMSVHQTSLADSFHDLGVLDLHGLEDTRLGKLNSPAMGGKCDCSCASQLRFQTRRDRSSFLFRTRLGLIVGKSTLVNRLQDRRSIPTVKDV
jgi:hypothetical protein